MAIRRAQKRQDAEAKRRSDNPPARIAQTDGINSAPDLKSAPTSISSGARTETNSAPTDINSAPDDLPEELIAARAYEKWRLRGCPMGQDGEQDWYAARSELEAERLGWAAPQAGDDQRSGTQSVTKNVTK